MRTAARRVTRHHEGHNHGVWGLMRGRTYRRRVARQLNTAQLPAGVFPLGDLLKEKQGREGGGRGRKSMAEPAGHQAKHQEPAALHR